MITQTNAIFLRLYEKLNGEKPKIMERERYLARLLYSQVLIEVNWSKGNAKLELKTLIKYITALTILGSYRGH